MMQDFWQLFGSQILGALALGSIVVFTMVLAVWALIYVFLVNVRRFMDPVDEKGNRIAPWPKCVKCGRNDRITFDPPKSGIFHCERCKHSFKKKATK